jgi:hypothetical protein
MDITTHPGEDEEMENQGQKRRYTLSHTAIEPLPKKPCVESPELSDEHLTLCKRCVALDFGQIFSTKLIEASENLSWIWKNLSMK